MRPRLRRGAALVLLMLFGCLLGMAASEAGLRLLGAGQPGLYTYDPDRGWALRPGAQALQNKEGAAFVRVSSDGLRDREHPHRKPKNTLRIAILGDSFTEAKQVPLEQTFSAVIERRTACRALGASNVETINFGCDSYGTAQELMTLRRQAWKFSPDVVVLAFCTGNDVRNDSVDLEGDKCQPFLVYHQGELVLAGPFEESQWFRFQCMMRFESQRSAMLNVMGQVRSRLRARSRARAQSSRALRGSEPGLEDWTYKAPTDRTRRQAWDVAEGEIELIHQEAARHGAEFLVVTLSNGIQVYPDVAVREAYMRRMGVTDLFYPDLRIRALGVRRGFSVLNLAAPMQAYADQHRVYLHGFTNTGLGFGHWNQEGHRLAGELIADRLCELLSRSHPAAVEGGRPAR